MNEELISIIVPVYNCKKTIDKCINSVLQQTYQKFELILVDDGSIDGTSKICDDYVKLNTNVICIHKKNEGVSKARNTGLIESKGKYIMFIDSDDYIENNMLHDMKKAMEYSKADIVICGYNVIKNGRKKKNEIQIDSNVSEREKLNYLYQNFYLNVVWNKIYLKEKISTLFNENINNGEDMIFNLEYIKNCKKIEIIKETLYNYLIEDKKVSLSQMYEKESFNNIFKIYEMSKTLYLKKFNKNTDMYSINKIFKINLLNIIQNIAVDKNLKKNKKEELIINIINKTKKTNIYEYTYVTNNFEKVINILVKKNKIKKIIKICRFKYFIKRIKLLNMRLYTI